MTTLNDYRPLSYWLEHPPKQVVFSPEVFGIWASTLLGNLPQKTSLSIASSKDGFAYCLRGHPLCPKPGPEDFSFTAYSEIIGDDARLHLGRVDVDELYRGNGIGGAALVAQLAAAHDAELDFATFTAEEKGVTNWLPYRPDLYWGTMTMEDFSDRFANVLRNAAQRAKIDSFLADELIEQASREDEGLLREVLDHDELQEPMPTRRGRPLTLAAKLIKQTGAWSGSFNLGCPETLARVTAPLEINSNRFAVWRPVALTHSL